MNVQRWGFLLSMTLAAATAASAQAVTPGIEPISGGAQTSKSIPNSSGVDPFIPWS